MLITIKDFTGKELECFNVFLEKNFKNIQITPKILSQAGKKIIINYSIPVVDIHGYWHSELFRPSMQLGWNITLEGAGNRNTPFITFFNQDSQNIFATYLTSLIDDFKIVVKINQETCCYDFSVEVAITKKTGHFDIVLDASYKVWTEVVATFRKNVVSKVPNYPREAWDAVYCTWYAVHTKLTIDYLEQETQDAHDLGFGTFIIDDGWSFSDMKRATPETVNSWYENIGTWSICEKKLPNFKEHVKRAQSLGLNYLIWVAPFFIGAKNKYFNSKHKFLSEVAAGRKIIDADDETLADYSLSQIIKLFKDYEVDGLKIDFLADIPPDVDTPHGRSAYEYIEKLCSGIKEIKQNALIEFRQIYSTPATLQLATQFRATDTPCDFIENFHRIAQLRVMLGDKVPIHSDPAYWNINDSEINVARHLISAMTGVPMVSINLSELPEPQRQIIKYHLNYYRENIDVFINGHWEVRYEYSRVVYMKVSYASTAIIFLASKFYFSEAVDDTCLKDITVFNLDSCEFELPQDWEVFTLSGDFVNGNYIPVAGMGKYKL